MHTLERLWLSIVLIPVATLFRALVYILAAGATYVAIRLLLSRSSFLQHRRVSNHEIVDGQIKREFRQSMRTVIIFGLVHGALVFAALSGLTKTYRHIDNYGWPWFVLSIGITIILHDTYFYWTHRLMHHPLLFRGVHRTHHLSISTTPWAAYAFSPLEALVQAGIAPLIVFTMPVHPLAFLIFMAWQITFNVIGHCGYEIYPHGFIRSWLSTLLNSVTHHGLHHEKFRGNYGLYFNLWDRLMGTNHHLYQERFDTLTATAEARDRTVPHWAHRGTLETVETVG